MNKGFSLEKFNYSPLQPRVLKYRSHYRLYTLSYFLICFIFIGWFLGEIVRTNFTTFYQENFSFILLSFFSILALSFFQWVILHPRSKRSIQVFEDHILVKSGNLDEKFFFSDVVKWKNVFYSTFYFHTKDEKKFFFNASLERIDYVWEGFYRARPDLVTKEEYEDFRIKLVQFDHHQKRKEWFFKHQFLDLINWVLMPVLFLVFAYWYQSQDVLIHHPVGYFFKLFLYILLCLIAFSFVFSITLKSLIFDQKVKEKIEDGNEKNRDLEFEGYVLERSKMCQLVLASCLLTVFLKFDLNLFSVAKIKDGTGKSPSTVFVDNRYNCFSCKYSLKDGDLVVFQKGLVGQVLAKSGETIGQIKRDQEGRMMASSNLTVVPDGYFAVQSLDGKKIDFIKESELIGKVQN